MYFILVINLHLYKFEQTNVFIYISIIFIYLGYVNREEIFNCFTLISYSVNIKQQIQLENNAAII